MKLVLHIGTEKTATTAAQYWFNDNTEALRAQGIWYAQALGLPNNRALSVMARPSNDREDGFNYFGLDTPEQHAAFVKDRQAQLAADVAQAQAAGARIYLISSEHLQSRLPTHEMVARAAEIVTPLFDAVEVVCFLRPQVDTAISLASTGSRVGNFIDKQFFRTLRPATKFYDYAGLIDRWAQAFGKDALTLVPFKRNPAPVAFFKTHLALDPQAELIPDRRINSTLDYRVVALTNHVVGEAQRNAPRTIPQMARRYYVDDMPCDAPLSLSLADGQMFHEQFMPMNRQIAAEWPTITEDDLTPRWEKYPEVGTVDKLETADFSAFLQLIFCRFNADLSMQRARIMLHESRTAEREGNMVEAIDLMEKARSNLEAATTVDYTRDWAADQLYHYTVRRDALLTRAADQGIAHKSHSI